MNAVTFRAPAQENVTIPCTTELKLGFIRQNNHVHTISTIFRVNFILHSVHCILVPQKYARRYPKLDWTHGPVLQRRSAPHAAVTKSDVWFLVAVILLILMFAVDAEKLVDCMQGKRPMRFFFSRTTDVLRNVD